LQETFFEPLGMTSTDLERNTALIPRMAEGYSNATTRANYINMNIPYSAGALVSTVGDLFKWQRALLTGQIVSQESLDTMWERAIDVEDFGSKYGYGLFRMTMNGQEVIGHGGGINGFVSYLINLPAHDISIIVLSNREDAALDSILALVIDNLVPVSSG
jgi:CubicO group peptidase (beta-lactamase class C family)